MAMDTPTIAEERLARTIAFWHGAKVLYVKPGVGMVTVAASRGFISGWAHEIDRYADRHWPEYVPAARAIMEMR
jgi:hypothetical protein